MNQATAYVMVENTRDTGILIGYKRMSQQHQQQQQQPAFMDQSFFYGLDQLGSDDPLFFMQQQQQQQQQQQLQQQTASLFEDHFLKEATDHAGASNDNRGTMNASSTTLAQSIATSMESFQAAVTTSVGEQPPSFWTGLNNFISNVTHNNIFPTFPNIARSFQEYLANHPVPFLSSFNAPTASPISSPMPPSSMDFDPMMQFKQEAERSDTGYGIPSCTPHLFTANVLDRLQIRVLGVPQTGAKSRVETQIKLCIQLVTDGGDKAQWWSHLKLPENMVTKDKLKKSSNNSNVNENGLPVNPEKALYLQARVLCASDPSKKVVTCLGCIQRERKRSQRRKENKQQQQQHNNDEAEDEKTEDEQSLAADEERVLLFNCSEVVDFSAGDTILPTRITCYCRHHNERLGFCIYFEMLDHTGKKVAEGISPPIMITDDHKSNKVKAGLKRRRTESEVLPEPRIPSLSWIKSSLPFGQPAMKRLIPNEAPTSGGIEITILGTNFRPGMTVMFGDRPAANIQYWSPNTLICTLPPATQPGAVVVSFKEAPPTDKSDVMVFTYLVETDRALMELALQVVGMKMTGIVEDARKIAMRIVQGNNGNQQADSSNNPLFKHVKSEP
ncbi:hypothetical protein FB192DRAFT_1437268 [Mucor lusitanicus]|uniref:IPT/TIG domain-containing protein n=1 Tax=Mucor circinelloides f. lusitanicus TaxID=29924 RepID=A0A8H4BGC9_MUCCL|nr:hypothetical protein FB192DRAFT_1437268 [Mucor lusitanicus]